MKKLLTTALSAALLVGAARAQETLTENDVVTGKMTIEFKTRTEVDDKGNPKEGALDNYKFTFNVAKTTEFAGEIQRQPPLYGKLWGTKQAAMMNYDIKLSVINPKDMTQKKQVGSWAGSVPLDPETGINNLSGSVENPLRIAVETTGAMQGFTDKFDGKLHGKAEKKEGLASSVYTRIVGGKTVEVKVQKADPIKFENVTLAKGPAPTYPRTIVNGSMDYDYDTGNWILNNVVMTYSVDGKDYKDVLTGSIKWIPDGDYQASGKGYYDFNVRFNEEANKGASSEDAAFATMSAEDAFFAVDTSMPGLTGKITYDDVMVSRIEMPGKSESTYNLNATKLTKTQIMNFFKLWLLVSGPANDE